MRATICSTQATTGANIIAKALTVSGTCSNKVYDGTTSANVNAAGAVYGGIVAGDIVTVGTASGAFTDKNVGTGKTVTITAGITGADAGNYVISTQAATTANITQATLNVSGITAANKVYDGTTTAVLNVGSVSYTGMFTGDVVAINASGGLFVDKNAGVGKTVTFANSLIGTDAGNYVLTGQTSTTADISARALTVTAIGQSRIYDGSTGATVMLSDNRIAGDVLTLGYGTASFADKNVGNAKAVAVSAISLAGTDAGNYLANISTTTSANITPKALTVSGITASNKVYDGTTSANINAAGAVYGGIVAGDIVSVGAASGVFANKNVGVGKTVTISAGISGADAANYSISTQAATTADITPAALSVSGITASNKMYDGTTAAVLNIGGVSYTGMFAGDVVAVSTSGGLFIDKNAGLGKTVTFASSLIGADAGNYVLTGQASTTADISARALTVTAIGQSRIYDGTAGATVTLTDSRIAGDVLTLGYGTASFSDKNVGNAKAVTVSAISLAGTDAGNYLETPRQQPVRISLPKL
jgi:hypothetical protein